MTLEEKVNSELKTAMLAKEEAAVRGLRAIKQAILMAKTSGATAVSADDEIKMLQKLVKQRKESVEIYQQQNRPDLAKPELEEIAVIEKFLPKQMEEAEIRSELKRIIGELGAGSPQDMGKVMGAASKFFAGKADNKIVSQLVRELLTGS
ncbi:MAG TPA: GatB/YqeY domain-containing protein [Bacteroidia bacterium]|nr:GatB/YqeY domain-containing protein [Bacteroidia bacterium]